MKTTKLPKARENAGDQVVIGFNFTNDWLIEWREVSGPITDRRQTKAISVTFDTDLKICVLKAIHHWLSVLTNEASKENKEFRRSSLLILCLNDPVNCSYTVSHFEPNQGRTYCSPVQELKNSLEEIGCTKKNTEI